MPRREISAHRQNGHSRKDFPFHWLIPPKVITLFSPCYGVAFVNPILTKIVRNVENPHVRETLVAEFLVRGIDVWTLAPGTTTAVKHDGLGVRQSSNPLATLLKPLRSRSRADVFGMRDVRLQIENMKPNLQNEGLVALGRLHTPGQLSCGAELFDWVVAARDFEELVFSA